MRPVVVTKVNSFNINGQPESLALVLDEKQLAHIHSCLNFHEYASGDSSDLHMKTIEPIQVYLESITTR